MQLSSLRRVLLKLPFAAAFAAHWGSSGAVPAPEILDGGRGRRLRDEPLCGGTTDSSNASAPKVIRSRELTSFSASFSILSMAGVPMRSRMLYPVAPPPDEPPQGQWKVSIERKGDVAEFTIGISDGVYNFSSKDQHTVSGQVPCSFVEKLQGIIEADGLAKINGFYKRNSAIGCNFSVTALYASGEKIHAAGEGGASVLPRSNWHPWHFARFFAEVAAQAGKPITSSAVRTGMNLLVWRFAFPEPMDGIPAGRYDFQAYRSSRLGGYEYRMQYRRDYNLPLQVIAARCSAEDLQQAARIFEQHRLARLDGFSSHYGRSNPGGEWSFGVVAEFDQGKRVEATAVGRLDDFPQEDYWQVGWFIPFFEALAARDGHPRAIEELTRQGK